MTYTEIDFDLAIEEINRMIYNLKQGDKVNFLKEMKNALLNCDTNKLEEWKKIRLDFI